MERASLSIADIHRYDLPCPAKYGLDAKALPGRKDSEGFHVVYMTFAKDPEDLSHEVLGSNTEAGCRSWDTEGRGSRVEVGSGTRVILRIKYYLP